jgi:hypothetical protein
LNHLNDKRNTHTETKKERGRGVVSLHCAVQVEGGGCIAHWLAEEGRRDGFPCSAAEKKKKDVDGDAQFFVSHFFCRLLWLPLSSFTRINSLPPSIIIIPSKSSPPSTTPTPLLSADPKAKDCGFLRRRVLFLCCRLCPAFVIVRPLLQQSIDASHSLRQPCVQQPSLPPQLSVHPRLCVSVTASIHHSRQTWHQYPLHFGPISRHRCGIEFGIFLLAHSSSTLLPAHRRTFSLPPPFPCAATLASANLLLCSVSSTLLALPQFRTTATQKTLSTHCKDRRTSPHPHVSALKAEPGTPPRC